MSGGSISTDTCVLAHRAEIDGLRALAVLPVMFFHGGFNLFSGGYVGVDIFFVISGYLITMIIFTEIRSGKFTLLSFYERRARRILPALFLVLLVCIPFAWAWLTPSHMSEFTASLKYLAAFVSNIYFYKESGYFGPEAELEPLLHTWSLSVEEQYYVFYPLLMVLLWKFTPRLLPFAILGLGVISLAYAHYEVTENPYAAFFLLPSRIWELMVGGLLAYLVVQGKLVVRPNQVASLLGLCLILYAVFAFTDDTPTPSLYTLVPTVGAALIILYATPGTHVGAILSLKPFVWIGLISYSAYLWHQPIFAFARHRSLAEPSPEIMLTLLLLSLALAGLSWRYVEQPFRRRQWIERRQILAGSVLLSAAFFSVGMLGKTTDGFAFRFPIDEQVDRELKRAAKERERLIRADICHFNDSTKLGLDRFLTQWHCKGDNSADGRKIPLIVTGDSHSGDIAMALRLNGLNPLQLGGAGCSLVPRKMTHGCRMIFGKLLQEVGEDDSYHYLALVNSFSEDELTPQAITEMLSYWRQFGKKLIFFVGMPHFPYFKERLTYGEKPTFNHTLSDLSKQSSLIQLLSIEGVHIVDREKIFCAINECGFLSRDGSLLLSGRTHLSELGARLFGQRLVSEDPLFRELANSASAVAAGVKDSHAAKRLFDPGDSN